MFAGSGDNDHAGYDFDYPGAHALAIAEALDTPWGIHLYDADGKQDRAIGLSYPAVPVLSPDVVNYGDSVSRGVESLLTEIGSIRSRCGALHPILLVGFSQGAHVIQDTLARLDNAAGQGDQSWHSIAGVALFGSPRFDPTDPAARGTFAANYPANGILGAAKIPNRFAHLTHTYCVVNDIVCQSIGTIDNHTRGYPADSDIVRDATGLLAHTVRARSGGVASPNPGGDLHAYVRQPLAGPRLPLNRVVSAAEIYTMGAPTTTFAWDIDDDGTIDTTTTNAVTEVRFNPARPQVSVRIAIADGSSITRCIRLKPTTTSPC